MEALLYVQVQSHPDGWRWTYRWMTDDAYPLHPFSSKQGFLVFGQFGSSLEGVRTNLLTSTDGISWTVQKFPNGFEFDEERAPLIIWGDRFVAAGRNLDGDTLLASSLNGETWDLHALPETPKLIEFRALASDNVTVVTAATDESGRGLLLQSDSAGGQPPDPVAPAALQLQIYPGLSITGTVGGTYTIESTSDLTVPAHWEVETNLTLSTNPQLWIDLRGDGQRRFYRAISR